MYNKHLECNIYDRPNDKKRKHCEKQIYVVKISPTNTKKSKQHSEYMKEVKEKIHQKVNDNEKYNDED